MVKSAKSFFLLCLINVAFADTPQASSTEVEQLIKKLTDDDPKVMIETRQKLIDLGPSISPAVFDQLFIVSWEIKPRLIEVLSRTAVDYSLVKLHGGNPSERQFAAVIYKLNMGYSKFNAKADPHTLEEVVIALRTALKSEDKNLRALAALALIDETWPKRLVQYWSEIIPAMISSFDTSLTIDHRHREDPSDAVMFGMVLYLDVLIGDAPEFASIQETLLARVPLAPPRDNQIWTMQREMSKFVEGNREELDALRVRWNDW